jgi:hypothetical protein
MRHFSSEQWTDFVRSTLKQEDMREMQAHLESGCEHCKADLAAWTRVTDLGAREDAYEPPAAAVKMAKAALKLHGQPARSPIAKLLFDSLQTPVVAGVRSSSSQPRQMLYGFDDYRVDLRFEPNFDADKALLVGQILSTDTPAASLGRIDVTLTRGGQVLGSTRTNEFGEFQLQCDLGGRLELQLTLRGGEAVVVPMVEPAAGEDKSKGSQLVAGNRLTRKSKPKKKSTRK